MLFFIDKRTETVHSLTMMTETKNIFKVYTVIKNRTWSFVHSTGLEIAIITGKKRARAFKAALENSVLKSFDEMRTFAIEWKVNNPNG